MPRKVAVTQEAQTDSPTKKGLRRQEHWIRVSLNQPDLISQFLAGKIGNFGSE